MKFSDSLQKMLPFGYLFLVIMGILKESVYYYQVGINILKYSTLMDVLISPIADLTSHPLLFVVVTVLAILTYAIPSLLSKQSHKTWVRKMAGLKKDRSELTEEEVASHFSKLFVRYFAFCTLSFFLGIGLGEGIGLSKRIKTDRLNYNYKLNYNSGESEEIYIIGSNSVYYFFMSKGNKIVKIAPVGVIKSLELIHNKMLQ